MKPKPTEIFRTKKLEIAFNKLMKKTQLTDSQIAKKIGVSPPRISEWRSKKYNIRFEKLAEIAKAIGYRVDIVISK